MKAKHALAGALALACALGASPALADPAGFLLYGDRVSEYAPAGAPRARPKWARMHGAPVSSAPLLAVARRYVGRGKVTAFRGPWCRDFVNLVARRAGVRLANHSRRAIDARHLGVRVANPRPGDLAVMRHHVTIFAGWSHGGRFVGLGGNQGHRVKYSRFAARSVVAFVRL